MSKEIEQAALEIVKERNPQGKEFNTHHTYEDFFGGNLVTIGFKVEAGEADKKVDVALENYIYHDGKNTHHYRFQNEFLHDISKRQSKGSSLKQFADVYGTSGSIAMVLTLAIGYLAIKQMPIPDILANSLTVIIGFYFGAQSVKK